VSNLDSFNKSILFISHSYNSFQKDSINEVSKYFLNTHVLVRHNPIAEITNIVNIAFLNQFKLDVLIVNKQKPSNVSLFPTPVLYMPLDSQYKKLGKKHLKSVEEIIKKKGIQFDIIHSHFAWSAGYVGAKLKKKYNVPFVVTLHGFDIYDLPFKDDEWKEKIEYVLNSADHIITVSKSNLECIKKLNVNTPVTVLPNGYRPDLFYPRNSKRCRNELNLPNNKKIILAVGNLVEIKGHKYLIEAMGELLKHRKDVQCYIIGGGALEKKLKEQIVSAGLEDFVTLVGAKPHSEIPIWMGACDLFVLPSLNEGNPTVMFECLGCGKPFVGTKVGGIPEIITSDDYGLLVEPCDSQDLNKKIEIALDKEWDEGQIKEYAEQYQWENIAEKIQHIYSSVLRYESNIDSDNIKIP
jgi:glycosyltransferase involved in cell wall biosynthesis